MVHFFQHEFFKALTAADDDDDDEDEVDAQDTVVELYRYIIYNHMSLYMGLKFSY